MSDEITNESLGEQKDSWPVMIVGTAALALFMLFVMPRVFKFIAAPYEDRAHEHLLMKSAGHMKQLEYKLVAFAEEHGRYPGVFRGPSIMIWDQDRPDPPPWAVTERRILHDGWGRELVFTVPSEDGKHPFDVRCLGRDGLPGGEGPDRDISTWDWPSRIEAPWPEGTGPTATPTP